MLYTNHITTQHEFSKILKENKHLIIKFILVCFYIFVKMFFTLNTYRNTERSIYFYFINIIDSVIYSLIAFIGLLILYFIRCLIDYIINNILLFVINKTRRNIINIRRNINTNIACYIDNIKQYIDKTRRIIINSLTQHINKIIEIIINTLQFIINSITQITQKKNKLLKRKTNYSKEKSRDKKINVN